MDPQALTVLVGMFITLVGLILTMMWHMQREFRRSREATAQQFQAQRAETAEQFKHTHDRIDTLRTHTDRQFEVQRQETNRQFDGLHAEFAKHKRITEENHRDTRAQLRVISISLGDTRERLARIEGHFKITPAPPPSADAPDDAPEETVARP